MASAKCNFIATCETYIKASGGVPTVIGMPVQRPKMPHKHKRGLSTRKDMLPYRSCVVSPTSKAHCVVQRSLLLPALKAK